MNKLLTTYTDTHQTLYENYFLPSYQNVLSQSYQLITKKIEQKCKTGDWGSEGFDEATLEKLKFITDNIVPGENKLLVFADCDIQFFKPLNFLYESILDNHIYFQLDPPCWTCTGFFVCKQTELVLNFFKTACNILSASLGQKTDDQGVILRLQMPGITKCTLPLNEYWTVGENGHWNGQKIIPPASIIMHHANFTIGVKNKEKLLQMIKEQIHNKQ